MKLRGKIIVAFLAVMMMPLFLMSVATVSVFSMQFHSMEQNFELNQNTLAILTNPILLSNRITRDVYNEMKLCATKAPERLEDPEFVEVLNARAGEAFSCLVLRKDGEIVYFGGGTLPEGLVKQFPGFGEHSTSVDAGTYVGGDSPVLIKQQDFRYQDGAEGSIFIITDVSLVLNTIQSGLIQVLISIVLTMFATALLLTLWLYRSMLRPLKALQNSTNQIKEGNLNVSVKNTSQDEIGELCNDFEEMRLHVKSLLEENMKHQRESKELISNISHDLKTPLTAIKGYAEGILDGVADTSEKQAKYLRTIYSKASDMSTLVDELSMYAKIDTNSVPYNFRELNLYRYFEDSVEESRLDLELQGMELSYFPHVDKEQDIIADPEQLKRVVNNIISNAVKYREPTRKGAISIRTTDIDDYYVRVEIEDNGKGIAADDLPHIFDRFYRTDASRNSSTGGSGLGLAISRKILEDHGGAIWAESRLGVGTTIFILLRKVWPQTATAEEPAAGKANAEQRHEPRGIGRILRGSKLLRK